MTSTDAFYEDRLTDLPRIDKRLKRVIEICVALGPSSLVDVGCGRGVLLESLRSAFAAQGTVCTLVGVEVSSESVRETRERGLDVIQGSVVPALPLNDAAFDVATFGEVIEHLYDPDAALLELSRILKTNGNLVITTPNLASWFNRLLLLFGIQPAFTEVSIHVQLGRKLRALNQHGPAVGHIRVFTLSALRDMLAGNGFEIAAIYGAPYHSAGLFGVIDGFLSRVPWLASNFVIVARNKRTLQTTYAISGPVRQT